MKKTVWLVLLNSLLLVALFVATYFLLSAWKERQISQFVAQQETILTKGGQAILKEGNVGTTHVLAALPKTAEGQTAGVETAMMGYVKDQLGDKKPAGKIEKIVVVSSLDGQTLFQQVRAKEVQIKEYKVDWLTIQESQTHKGGTLLLREDGQIFTLANFLPNTAGAKNILISKLGEALTQKGMETSKMEAILELCKELDLASLDFSYTEGQLTVDLADKEYGVDTVTLPLSDLYPVLDSNYLSAGDKEAYDAFVAAQAIDKKVLRQIALTFDDGPNPDTTPRILDLLKQYKAKGTFFVVGRAVAGNEALLKRIVDEGHEVGNHTWNHPNLTTISVDEVRKEIQDTQAAIKSVIGYNPTTVRPPYGAINQAAVDAIGLPSIYWSVDSEDWRNRDQHIIYERIKTQTQPGSIILMHDIHQPTVDALEPVLQFLTAEGYNMVTTTELLGGNLNPQLIYYNQEAAGPAH